MTRQHIQGTPWGSTGGGITDPGSVKTLLGYVDEKPPYQTENFKANRADEMLAHIEEYGMPVWDALTTYNDKSYAAGSDGLIYKSLQNANINHDAISSPSWWALAFMDLTTAQTVTGTKTMNALKLGGNLDANNKKIVLLSAPTSNQDAANKAYVDALRAFAYNSTVALTTGTNNNPIASPFIITDGTEIVTVTLAGLTIGHTVEVQSFVQGGVSNAAELQSALFVDAVPASLAVGSNDSDSTQDTCSVSLLAYFVATATTHTFRMRVSSQSGTYSINNVFGGTSKSWISAKRVGI